MGSEASWRLSQGVGFLAGVLAKSVYELEEFRHEYHGDIQAPADIKLQGMLDGLYSGVEESRALLPDLLKFVQDQTDQPYRVPEALAPVPAQAMSQHGGPAQISAVLPLLEERTHVHHLVSLPYLSPGLGHH
jgi:hypothetical protein